MMDVRRQIKIGSYEYLKELKTQLKKDKLFKRLFSVDFGNMPFFKYAITITALLGENYFVNALIISKAKKETDITWLLKDYATKVDFISDDFSQFEKDPDLYEEINFITGDFLSNKFSKKYDLVLLFEDLEIFYKRITDYLLKLGLITEPNARIIFFLKSEKATITNSEQIINLIPFEIRKKVELKNYEQGKVKDIDLVIDTIKNQK